MTVTISRLYDDYASASRAVGELEAAGIPHSDISIVASNADNWYATEGNGPTTTTTRPGAARTTANLDRDGDGVDDRAEGAATGSGIGAALGAAGVMAGPGLMALAGPVVAAGWLGLHVGGSWQAVFAAVYWCSRRLARSPEATPARGVRRSGTMVPRGYPIVSACAAKPSFDRPLTSGIAKRPIEGCWVTSHERFTHPTTGAARTETYRDCGAADEFC